jgi:hypothetical protein
LKVRLSVKHCEAEETESWVLHYLHIYPITNRMSSVAKSIYYFSVYLLLAGLALFFIPNQILALIGIAPTSEVWISLVGALTFIVGVFFHHMARRMCVSSFLYRCSDVAPLRLPFSFSSSFGMHLWEFSYSRQSM